MTDHMTSKQEAERSARHWLIEDTEAYCPTCARDFNYAECYLRRSCFIHGDFEGFDCPKCPVRKPRVDPGPGGDGLG